MVVHEPPQGPAGAAAAPSQGSTAARTGPPGRRPRSVTRLLLWPSLIFLLCMAFLLGGVALWNYELSIREARRTSAELSRLMANQSARMLEAADVVLLHLIEIAKYTDWSQAPDVNAAKMRFNRISDALPYVSNLFIYDASGTVRFTALESSPADLNVADRKFFTVHREFDRGPQISGLLHDRASGEPFFVLTRRVTSPDGSFGGIVLVSFRPQGIAGYYRSLSLGYPFTLELVHRDGTVLVHEPTAAGPPRNNLTLAEQIAAAPQATRIYRSLDGTERVGSYSPVGALPLYASISISKRAIVDSWLGASWPYLLFSVLALLALSLMAFVAIRRARSEDSYRAELAAAKNQLEDRVRERTLQLQEALRLKDVLFKELNHRVKNNLQMVGSLMRLQASRAPDPATAEGFENCLRRLQSMGLVHELLYLRDNLTSLDFGEYMEMLCRRIGDALDRERRIALRVHTEGVQLNAEQAVPLALILNELMANAYKHAFPEGRRGSIEVRFHRRDGGVELSVSDDGVGCEEGAGRSNSLGLQLVRGLSGQLDGKLEQTTGEGTGTRVSLRFIPAPISDAIDPGASGKAARSDSTVAAE